ncbi:MAG: D-alanyl-D-alanine carboxypeptidase family protein [Nakamurella sp.]
MVVGPSRKRLISTALAGTVFALVAGCGGGNDAEAAAAAASSSVAAAISSAVSASSVAQASAVSAQAAAAAAAAEASRQAAAAAMAAAAQSAQQSSTAAAAAGADPIAVAGQHAATIDAARSTADLDAPGDDNGVVCATDPQYVDEQPTGLQPDLVAAWQTALAQAAAVGVTLCLEDGKRSRTQQQATYDDYVKQYGQAMADEYVLPPEQSAHVLGLAIDVQPLAGHNWLEQTAGSLGLCRTYDNETWHFEYDPIFVTQGCPTRMAHPGS